MVPTLYIITSDGLGPKLFQLQSAVAAVGKGHVPPELCLLVLRRLHPLV